MVSAGALMDQINADIRDNKVMVYSKSYCPFAGASKSLLRGKGCAMKVIELDQVSNGQAIQDALKTKTGQSTVPNIFINGEHIGGNSDLQALN